MGEKGGGVCELECPKCNKSWGRMKFKYGGDVKAKDVTIMAGKKRKLKDGDPLACSLCGHEYTNYDILLAIAHMGL